MATITGQTKVATNWAQTLTGVPGSAQSVSVQQSAQFQVTTSGTAADQADLKFTATLLLAASPTVLDLTSLTDIYGGSVNFKRVRSITIVNKAATDGFTVKFGYSTTTSNAWTGIVTNPGQITINPSTAANNGIFVMTSPTATGWAVTSTNKLLNLDPGANTVAVDIEIVGCSV